MTATPALGEFALLLAFVTAGALVQGSLGFGFSLVAVPVLGLVSPGSLPATVLLLAIPMTVAMTIRERSDVDWPGLVRMTGGRILGTIAALWVLDVIAEERLTVVIGAMLVVAAGLSAIGPGFEAGTRTRLAAGALSGLMGTAAAVGGPPLALAYQNRPGPELRSTLAASFVIGSVMSLGGLALTGAVGVRHVVLAFQLAPGLAAGLLLSRFGRRMLDGRWLRPAVLVFAAVAGVVAIVRGLV